jgi:hypothetical protein
MGKRTTADRDQAIAALSGSFAGTRQSGSIELCGAFNLSLWGGVCTAQLERSFDGGTTFVPVTLPNVATLAAFTASSAGVSFRHAEPEAGVLYRLNCTAFTSATNYRISQ